MEVVFGLQSDKDISGMLGGGLNLALNDDGKSVSNSKNFDIYAMTL